MAAITNIADFLPNIYAALDVVSRERLGFIPAVAQDFSAETAAKGQVVRSPVVAPIDTEELTPAAYAPDYPARSIDYVDMTISKTKSAPFGITGEEEKGLSSSGTIDTVNTNSIAQALRSIANEVEADLYNELYKSVSAAHGTPGTTPFGTAGDFDDFAAAAQILDDNGAPDFDRQMVLGSAAIRNLRGKQSNLFKINEAGTDDLLRRGMLGEVEGFEIHKTHVIKTPVTAGTGASATTNTAGYAVGATVITLASAGTGTILAGDFVTFAGDTRKYQVVSGDTDVSNGGTITLAEPGLMQAIPAAATAITVVAASVRNLFFHRSAIQLATRAPAMPSGGDSADDVMSITDPLSGITYEFAMYKQKRQVRYEVNLAWGFKLIAPRHAGVLLG